MCGWSDSVATEFRQRAILERLEVDLDSCPVEFSMTCTNGGLVDMLNDFRIPKKGEMNRETNSSSVSGAHLMRLKRS